MSCAAISGQDGRVGGHEDCSHLERYRAVVWRGSCGGAAGVPGLHRPKPAASTDSLRSATGRSLRRVCGFVKLPAASRTI